MPNSHTNIQNSARAMSGFNFNILYNWFDVKFVIIIAPHKNNVPIIMKPIIQLKIQIALIVISTHWNIENIK